MIKKDIFPSRALLFIIATIYFVYFSIVGPALVIKIAGNLSLGLINFLVYSSSFLFMTIFILIYKQRYSLKINHKDVMLIIAGYFLIWILDGVSYRLINNFTPANPVPTNQKFLNIIKEQTPIYYYLSTIFLGPLVEELTYRFSLQNLFNKWIPKITGAIIIALIFGFFHIQHAILVEKNYYELINLISYSGSSLVFSWAYLKSKKMITPILLHIIVNLVSVL